MDDLKRRGFEWFLSNLPVYQKTDCVILDAATGAGNTTLELARMIQASEVAARVISVDIDPISWTDWAKPKLDKEGLAHFIEFRQADLCDLKALGIMFHGIVCTTTLSVMGLKAIEAVSLWRDLLLPNSPLIILDYMPSDSSLNAENDYGSLAWRLTKAADVLSGREWCDEFPPEFWVKFLSGQGFIVDQVVLDTSKPDKTQEALEEFLQSQLDVQWPRSGLIKALTDEYEEIKEQIKVEGRMSRLGGAFLILARRMG
jgi:SAM-dependent methyltransferase